MHKDFDSWNEKKKKLDSSNKKFLFKEGDIWWCSVGVNIGKESCGKGRNFLRPVLVLKKLSNHGFIGIPLTTKLSTNLWNIFLIVDGKKANAQIHQMKMLSSSRF